MKKWKASQNWQNEEWTWWLFQLHVMGKILIEK